MTFSPRLPLALAAIVFAGGLTFSLRQGPAPAVPNLSAAPTPGATALAEATAQVGLRVGPTSAYPDPTLTPGETNPNVGQENIGQTVCVSGWTSTVRPPASYTSGLKLQQMKLLALRGTAADFEEDHFIPLELGGNPTDPHNLWPEPWNGQYGAHEKDKVENFLHKAVCSGQMNLANAQALIVADWVKVQQANHL